MYYSLFALFGAFFYILLPPLVSAANQGAWYTQYTVSDFVTQAVSKSCVSSLVIRQSRMQDQVTK